MQRQPQAEGAQSGAAARRRSAGFTPAGNRQSLVALVFCASLLVASCGDKFGQRLDEEPEVEGARCDGLTVQILEDAVVPPANVGALVRVTDCSGSPLGEPLRADSFELAEDGAVLSPFEARRSIEPARREAEQVTLIALDLSGSITAAGLKPTMVEGARSLVRALAPKHRVALFGFDGRPDLIPYAHFSTDAAILEKALDEVARAPTVDDSTNLNGAIVSAIDVLDQAVGSRNRDPDTVAHGSLVVFTDGRDRAARASAVEAIAAIDRSAHSVLAIGVGAEIDGAFLARIGRTAYFLADDAGGVAAAFDGVAAKVTAIAARDYVVSYCSPARAGSHRLEIRVKDDGRSGRAEVEFSADGFGAGCSPDTTPIR